MTTVTGIAVQGQIGIPGAVGVATLAIDDPAPAGQVALHTCLTTDGRVSHVLDPFGRRNM